MAWAIRGGPGVSGEVVVLVAVAAFASASQKLVGSLHLLGLGNRVSSWWEKNDAKKALGEIAAT